MSATALAPIDAGRSEAFAERMLGSLNDAALVLMTSVGHRTGLFDAMAGHEPATSQAIADAAGLDERYVREWLGAMVTGGVVELDPATGLYHLPAEHAAVLTRAARPDNMAATAQWLAVLGSVEDQVIECFRRGGGVPYSAYGRFHEVMAEESDQTVVAVLLDSILPAVPGLVAALERGLDVLDVGCGSGRALATMAERFPRSRFTGFDLSFEAVENARQDTARRGLGNLAFEARDVADLDIRERFDLVTAFDAIHDQASPDTVLTGIAEALRPGGTFLMQDISGTSHVHEDIGHPAGTFLYTISCMHCMTVSLAEGGAGLGAMWGREVALRMLGEAGFRDIEVKQLPHDVLNDYYVSRR
jgi:2-polyprenyl-3-methyl-5-hydroxy-6-metoxy-1,4-benzoquinol methylase